MIFVDFHAEAPGEKEAFGLYFDGRASAVIGTHTHVQTADERILPGGTAYMTDAGMTGPIHSVIGVDPEGAVKRGITQVLYKMDLPETAAAIHGLIMDIDRRTRRAASVRRIRIEEPRPELRNSKK
ncbi:YmdB family metallophosphoesterase [Brucepastera parasyntrophica]|uniref:YmdB family metallophosphoesterase n=1 Tax=Brucepastera parasyntrophica TaxID=2880008 RepID=UPI00210BC602|nr:YmdB family metallophosphoesterase [Brucepastera parasyntrophica]